MGTITTNSPVFRTLRRDSSEAIEVVALQALPPCLAIYRLQAVPLPINSTNTVSVSGSSLVQAPPAGSTGGVVGEGRLMKSLRHELPKICLILSIVVWGFV